jgi:hypothetical protein
MHAMADLVAMAFDRLRIDNPSPALFFMENRSAVVFHCRYSITSYASSDSKPTKARGKYLGQCRRAALCNRCAERGRGVQTKASNPHSTLVKWNESSDVRAAASPRPHPATPHSNAHQLESNHPHAFARCNWACPREPGPTCHVSGATFYRPFVWAAFTRQVALTPRRR